jgi:hypothetical protein
MMLSFKSAFTPRRAAELLLSLLASLQQPSTVSRVSPRWWKFSIHETIAFGGITHQFRLHFGIVRLMILSEWQEANFVSFLETVVVGTGMGKILVVLFLTIFLSPLLLTKFLTDWREGRI